MKRTLTKDERKIFAEKTIELGNLTFIGFVVAQFVPGSYPIQFLLVIIGFMILIAMYSFAYIILKKGI